MDLSFLSAYWPYFNWGAIVTVGIALYVVFFGTLIGLVIALVQRSQWYPLAFLGKKGKATWIKTWNPFSMLASLYVWIFRGTPMIIQISLSVLLFSIPAPMLNLGGIQVDISRLLAGASMIALNSGAYVSETIRAGLASVPKGQVEAAYSLGMRPAKTMRLIVLPQAIRTILPALGNEFITILKDSSLLSYIGVMELWKGIDTVKNVTYKPLPVYLVGALYYLALTTILSALLKRGEAAIQKGHEG